MFVYDPLLFGWLNGERRWGQGICNSQKKLWTYIQCHKTARRCIL